QAIDVDSVPCLNSIDQVVSFREQEFGIAGEYLYARVYPVRHVEQCHALHAHSRCQGDVFSIGGECPRQHLFGFPTFSQHLHSLQIGSHSALSMELEVLLEFTPVKPCENEN